MNQNNNFIVTQVIKKIFVVVIASLAIIFMMHKLHSITNLMDENISNLEKNRKILVFFENGSTLEDHKEIETLLREKDMIKFLRYVPKDLALNQLEDLLELDSILTTTSNPLYDYLIITLNLDAQVEDVVTLLDGNPKIALLDYDESFLNDLSSQANSIKDSVKSISFLSFVCFFVITFGLFLLASDSIKSIYSAFLYFALIGILVFIFSIIFKVFILSSFTIYALAGFSGVLVSIIFNIFMESRV